MKVPIPDDWSGEWECFNIEWPNSPNWLAILLGLLTTIGQGRYWDEKTGTIKDAQAIANEMFERNYPFRFCDGSGGGDVNIELLEMLCGILGDCEDDMGCVLPYGSIKYIDGILHYKTCEGMIPVEGAEGVVINPPPDTGDNQTGSNFACNKAYGIADSVMLVAADFLSAVSGLGSVYEMYQPAHNVLSQFGSTWQTSQLVCAAYVANTTEIAELIGDAETVQWLACAWSPALDNTDNLTAAEQYTIQTTYPPIFTSAQRLFMVRMLQAVSFSTLAWWARLFADKSATCDCPDITPDGPTDPTANGWYLSRVFEMTVYDSGNYNTPMCLRALAEHDAFGVVYQCYWDEPNFASLKRMGSGTAGCSNYDVSAWGDTSDHLEYEAQGHYFGVGASSVLDEILGAGNYTLQTSTTYGTPTNPAAPTVNINTLVSHAYYGDDMEPGKYYTVRLRFIYNTGAPN